MATDPTRFSHGARPASPPATVLHLRSSSQPLCGNLCDPPHPSSPVAGDVGTAVIAGTATHVSNNVSRRQANRWAQQDAPPQQQYAEPAPAPPAVDPIEQLKKLGELHEAGVLTDEEFSAEKAKVLNG